MGVKNLSDADLAGSTTDFGSVLKHDSDLFYVHYLARDCTGSHPCLEIPESLVPEGDPIKVLQRNCIRPGTRRAPDPTLLLSPVSIALESPSGLPMGGAVPVPFAAPPR